MMSRWTILLVIVAAILCTGCVGPLPHYPWVSSADAMTTMYERAEKIETVSTTGRLSLSRASGSDVQLDCVMVYSQPDLLRLRAWKFSQAVLDFTMNGDGVWIVAQKRNSDTESTLPDSLSAKHIATTWSLVISGFSETQWEPCSSTQPETFAICGKHSAETDGLVCEIDRDTLTTQFCAAHNDEGDEQFRLSFRRYRSFGEIVLPTRIHAASKGNAFTWLLDEITLNEPLAPRAFVPPRRAVKQP